MPHDTFLNLPHDKRARFVDAALDEFASAPFDQASITAIVKRLGIAKGSVYQYFEDKFDLYAWLLSEAGARKAARFAGLALPDGADLFDRLSLAYRAGLLAWIEEPRWSHLGLRLFEPTTEPRLAALRRRQEAAIHDWLAAQLAEARARGEIRADLDPDTAAWFVQGVLQDGLLRAFLARLGTDLEGLPAAARTLSADRVADALSVAEDAVAMLRAALRAP